MYPLFLEREAQSGKHQEIEVGGSHIVLAVDVHKLTVRLVSGSLAKVGHHL